MIQILDQIPDGRDIEKICSTHTEKIIKQVLEMVEKYRRTIDKFLSEPKKEQLYKNLFA